MVKLSFWFATLTLTVMVAKTCAWIPGEEQCGCFNMTQIDKPSSISECYTRSKFLNQISENYNNTFTALQINGRPYDCDFKQYRKNVLGMKDLAEEIVHAYFSCNKANCTSAIMAAYEEYIDFRTNIFNPYIYCSMANLSSDCAQVLLQARPPVYGSVENIMVALLTCAKLKAQESNGKVQDPRPIPESRAECFSEDYIAKVRNFIKDNFKRVFSNYKTKQDSCDYKKLLGYIKQLQKVALEGTTLLKSTSSKFTQVDTFLKEYKGLLDQFNPAVRQFILNNDKFCYFNAEQAMLMKNKMLQNYTTEGQF